MISFDSSNPTSKPLDYGGFLQLLDEPTCLFLKVLHFHSSNHNCFLRKKRSFRKKLI